jgi:hypothetical protein
MTLLTDSPYSMKYELKELGTQQQCDLESDFSKPRTGQRTASIDNKNYLNFEKSVAL